MSRSPFRWALRTAAVGALFATMSSSAPAHADGPGTPSQPPPDMPPTQPLPPQAQQPQQQQVPSYQQYQRLHKKQSHWYGWQTLIVDGGWIVGGPLVGAASPGAGAGLILGGYFLGGPIVNWAHGQVGRGFADLGIRVGAPIVLGTLGYLALSDGRRGGDNLAGVAGAVIGVGLGMIAAIVIDASVLAYEPADDDDDDGRLHRTPRRNALLPATIAPMAGPRSEGGFVFGLSGTLY